MITNDVSANQEQGTHSKTGFLGSVHCSTVDTQITSLFGTSTHLPPFTL